MSKFEKGDWVRLKVQYSQWKAGDVLAFEKLEGLYAYVSSGDFKEWVDVRLLEPAPEPSAPVAGQDLAGGKPDGLAALRATYLELKYAGLERQLEQVKQQNRDLLGERDSLKAHVSRLEKALDLAQRRGRR